jgi:hypothetical protein
MHPAATAISNLPLGHQDLAGAIVEGFLAGRPVIAVINSPGVQDKPLIDAVLGTLADRLTRVVRVEEGSASRLGPPIAAIDELLEGGEADTSDTTSGDVPAKPLSPVDLGLKMLGCRSSGERRRLLVIESVHLLSPDVFEQLARLAETGPPELPVQMLLVGDATYWHMLQAAKFEHMRQRIGVPLMVLPSLELTDTALTPAQPSVARSTGDQGTRRVRRPRRAVVIVVLLAAVLSIIGVLQANADLRDALLAQISPIWTALIDRIHRLIG